MFNLQKIQELKEEIENLKKQHSYEIEKVKKEMQNRINFLQKQNKFIKNVKKNFTVKKAKEAEVGDYVSLKTGDIRKVVFIEDQVFLIDPLTNEIPSKFSHYSRNIKTDLNSVRQYMLNNDYI